MASNKAVYLVASMLIGAAVFAFVAYTVFDSIGFGREVEYWDEYAPTWGSNETINLQFIPEDQPVVTYWNLTGGAVPEVNGTVATTNITWVDGTNSVYVYCQAWDGDVITMVPYGKDTAYLKFNYTGEGSTARTIAEPAVILVAVMSILIVAVVMVSKTRGLKGGGKKW